MRSETSCDLFICISNFDGLADGVGRTLLSGACVDSADGTSVADGISVSDGTNNLFSGTGVSTGVGGIAAFSNFFV